MVLLSHDHLWEPTDFAAAVTGGVTAHVVMPFDQIIPAVLAGKAEAGLIIHEGQLTFLRQQLFKVIDLGEWWFSETGLPLPLGGNVVRKDLGPDMTSRISRHLRASIAYGLDHRANAWAPDFRDDFTPILETSPVDLRGGAR